MSVNQAEIHRLSLSISIEERLEAVHQLKTVFEYLNDKSAAFVDLHRLTCDEDSDVRMKAAEALAFVQSAVSDKYKSQAWDDLYRLTHDEDSSVRMETAATFQSLFPSIPDECKYTTLDGFNRLTYEINSNLLNDPLADDILIIQQEQNREFYEDALSIYESYDYISDPLNNPEADDVFKLQQEQSHEFFEDALSMYEPYDDFSNPLNNSETRDLLKLQQEQSSDKFEPEINNVTTFSSKLDYGTNQNEKIQILDVTEELKKNPSYLCFNSSESSAILDFDFITNLIAQFQKAIEQEIETVSKGTSQKSIKLTMGELVTSSSDHFVYRFLLEKIIKIPDETPLDVLIEGSKYNGYIVSVDSEGINIGLDVNLGETIQSTTIFVQYSKLLEILHGRFETVKSGDFNLNISGCLKLFGSHDSKLLSEPIQKQVDLSKYTYYPNDEQKQAIFKSLSQEVTFLWGPPGTGKTKVLSIILDQFVQANKKVLLVSHTNLAVDEILLKYLEIQENNEHVKCGKIIRHGTPTKKDNRLDALLIDNIIETKEKEKLEQIKSLESASNDCRIIIKNLDDKKILDIIRLLDQSTKTKSGVEENISVIQKSITYSETNISKLHLKIDENKVNLEKLEKAGIIKKLLTGSSKKKMIEDIILKEKEIAYEKQQLNQLKQKLNYLQIKKQDIDKYCEEIKSEFPKAYGKLRIPSSSVLSLEEIAKEKNSLMERIRDNDSKIEKINQEIQLSKESIFPNALVIGCTLTKAYIDSKLLNTKFDVMVLDEASMAQLPSVFFIAGIIEKSHYVIAGDFRQLSPIASSKTLEARMWLKRDIFAQAGIENNVNNDIVDKRLVMLREQYRMHEDIANLINNAMYKGKLITSETTIREKNRISTLSPFKNHAICLVDTSSINPWCKITSFGSKINIYSAILSVSLAKDALKGGIKSIGIITPYNAQAKLINIFLEEEDLLSKGIIAATIHKFQGNEKKCIIFDSVDSPPYNKGQILSGSYQKSEAGKLINVAISRAEGKFFLIANREYVYQNFKAEDALFCLLNDIERYGKSIDAKKILPSNFYKNIEKSLLSGNRLNLDGSQDEINRYLTMWNEKNFYDIFKRELLSAEKRVVIFSPFITRNRFSELGDIFRVLIEKGIKIYVVTRSPGHQGNIPIDKTKLIIDELKKMGIDVIIASKKVKLHEMFHEKCALIDNNIFFYGSLNILSQNNSSETMMAIKSTHIINNLVKEFKIDTIIQMYESPQTKTKAHEKQNGNEKSQFIIDKIKVALKNETKIDNCPNCQSSFVLMSDKENLYWCCPVDLKKGFDMRRNIPRHLIETTAHNLKISCPKCNNGHLRYKVGKYGPFLSCDQYPACKNTLNFK